MSDIQDLERELSAMKAGSAFFDAVERLSENPDFITVISKGYCRDHMADLATLFGSPKLGDKEREQVMKDMRAGGLFIEWFQSQKMQAQTLRDSINEYQEELLELNAESEGE